MNFNYSENFNQLAHFGHESDFSISEPDAEEIKERINFMPHVERAVTAAVAVSVAAVAISAIVVAPFALPSAVALGSGVSRGSTLVGHSITYPLIRSVIEKNFPTEPNPNLKRGE